jgi:AcrR family transcriptional regulator
MTVQDQRKSTAGRRRDPDIEPRVCAAAVRVYAREGWGGFTFDSVARESKVGKPAIYRRWSSREELLVRAIDTLSLPTARDCGSLRADLLDYALQWVDYYSDQDRAKAFQHLDADCWANPALRKLQSQLISEPRVQAARDITRRAVSRGELGPAVKSATVVELLVGSMSNHWKFTPEDALPRLRTTFASHAETLVEVILHGIVAVSLDPADPAARVAPRQGKRQAIGDPAAGPAKTPSRSS